MHSSMFLKKVWKGFAQFEATQAILGQCKESEENSYKKN